MPSNDDKVLYFPTMLGGGAFSVYHSLSDSEQNDIDSIKSKVLSAYSCLWLIYTDTLGLVTSNGIRVNIQCFQKLLVKF